VVRKKWTVGPLDERPAADLAREVPCSRLLARLLLRRGFPDAESARRFLKPRLQDLHDPFLLPGMEAATERIAQALQAREKVAVFGDYDVDGISSTCLLHDFFRHLGFPVTCRLPHRLNDGYGLKEDAVRELAAEGVTLIITVDNGASAHREVAVAREHGVDVVVTDHHQPPPEALRACAVVNPWLPGSAYPFKDLAGVGVTFKLVWALSQRLSRQKKVSEEFRRLLVDSLALAALGTISDVVPLVGENRIFAKFGLISLAETRRPGLRSLVDSVFDGGRDGRDGRRLEASHVAFRIGPRINAAGRLGEAERAMRLLITDDAAEASDLASHLDRENRRRQEIEGGILAEARALIRETVDLDRDRVIVLGAAGWHLGVIGIVASKIVEEFSRPVLLVALEEGRARGSARSVRGVHICEALSRCREHLSGFGGHEMAAGFQLDPAALPALRRALNEAVDREPRDMVPEVDVDDVILLADLTPEALAEILLLAPHGQGNPAPVFTAEDVEIVGQPRVLGASGRHLSFHVRQEGSVRRAIAFGQGDLLPALDRRGTRLSLLVAPQLSTFRGRSEVELNVRDLRVL
jgi:single-stranded-DNA-specific exonuclease